MKRVKFLDTNAKEFLGRVQRETNFSLHKLANLCRVHRRSFSDWKHDRYLMPLSVVQKLVSISELPFPRSSILSAYWHVAEAGRKGGLAVQRRYGTVPGWTKEASQKGGLAAMKTHQLRGTGLFTPKFISLPSYSKQLAEFVGILLGDGGLTPKQVSITLHRKDDRAFSMYVQKLIRALFFLEPSVYKRKGENVLNIVISRVILIRFFARMGIPTGGKVRQQTSVPSWIAQSKTFTKDCMRGLFDTDGCFYIDHHRYPGKIYEHCGMNFTNRSLPILRFFKTGLQKLDLHPTQTTKFSIFLRREKDIVRYFEEIGFSNPKHAQKFSAYFQKKYGEVPKWS